MPNSQSKYTPKTARPPALSHVGWSESKSNWVMLLSSQCTLTMENAIRFIKPSCLHEQLLTVEKKKKIVIYCYFPLLCRNEFPEEVIGQWEMDKICLSPFIYSRPVVWTLMVVCVGYMSRMNGRAAKSVFVSLVGRRVGETVKPVGMPVLKIIRKSYT